MTRTLEEFEHWAQSLVENDNPELGNLLQSYARAWRNEREQLLAIATMISLVGGKPSLPVD